MNSLKQFICLNSNVKIYVPGTINVNQISDNTNFVNDTLKLLSDYFGGSTSYQAIGYWQGIKENTTVCVSFCHEIDLKKHISYIINYCLKLKTELNQEAISLEVNNKLYFI